MLEKINMLDDLDAIWKPIADEAEKREHGQGELATSGNLVDINLALGKQAELFVEMRKHVKHEVTGILYSWLVSDSD